MPAEPAPDAGAGDAAAEDFPDHHVLVVVLGEFVHVMGAGQLVPVRRLEGDHRELHHVLSGDQVIEKLDGQRVHDVLGVLHDEDGELHVVLLLEVLDPHVDPVQAVGLAGGAGVAADDAVDVVVDLAQARHLPLGVEVVGVGADEDVEVGIVEGVDRVVDHVEDDVRLVPGRDHDGDRLLRHAHELLLGYGPVAFLDEKGPVDAPAEIDDVDDEFVEAADQEDAGDHKKQPLECEHEVGDVVDYS